MPGMPSRDRPGYTSPMNTRLALLLIALSPALSGCGNKGALVLAEKPAAEPAAATATQAPTGQDATAPAAPESTTDGEAGEDDPDGDD